uniref:PPIase cyclophilin-type domain-containing protein n=1 Tax=Haemonchus contortus TaxID=6289 RepID=A0A7I4YU01_HAECO|nr:Peptidyl-prolyl cis-trans isomerase domain containing protein [Haemonchus contortus]
MTSILGLICEAIAPRSRTKPHKPIPYCTMDPWVFFEFGFENGPTMERIEARLDHKASPKLVSNFVSLCKGDGPNLETGIESCFKGSPLFSVDSQRGIITTGDYINKNGSGGRAATTKGFIREDINPTGPAKAGSIIMLPNDTDATIYDSIFCILTQDVPYIEGRVIGKVTTGLDTLRYIVWKYGHWTGIPKENLVILNCGQL